LVGTWNLKSFVREVGGTGERYNHLGDHPDGYLAYSSDGRMLAFFVSGDQPRPQDEPSDEERIRLHKTMLAYGGTGTRGELIQACAVALVINQASIENQIISNNAKAAQTNQF
jgi:hypothetical protein